MRAPEPKYAVGEQVRHANSGMILTIRERWLDVPDPKLTCSECGQKIPQLKVWCYSFGDGTGYLPETSVVPLNTPWNDARWGSREVSESRGLLV